AKTQQAADLKEKYDHLQAKADAERKRYEDKISAIEKEKANIREKALIEAKAIMDSANRRVEQAVQKIVEQNKADKSEIKKIRKGISSEKAEINEELRNLEEQKEQQEELSDDPPKKGDFVRFKDGNTTGEL